ncbi:MAG: hypothetical protein J5I92_04255 [Thiogranum sp.]|nr:hypothetical protein [Thiogranum sp.]
MTGTILRSLAAVGLVLATGLAFGHTPPRTDLQRPETFLEEAFAGQVPAPGQIWRAGDVARQVEQILGHKPRWVRLPYWIKNGRTAWVLEESLDGAPVTVGVVVEHARIVSGHAIIPSQGHPNFPTLCPNRRVGHVEL